MKSYKIKDVWMALELAKKVFVYEFIAVIAVICLFGSRMSDILIYALFGAALFGALILHTIIVYVVNSSYEINEEHFTFPRSDIENSIFAIILLIPYWNLARKMRVRTDEIENLYIDSHKRAPFSISKGKKQKAITYYGINVTGSFGSAHLIFKSRQKRDETRNAIAQCVRKATGARVDKKVAEFS